MSATSSNAISSSAISSPCIKACMLDPVSKLCEGCGRSMAEIARWGSMSEAERLAIMARLRERETSRPG